MNNKKMINALYADNTEFDVELVKDVAERLRVLSEIWNERDRLERAFTCYLRRHKVLYQNNK